MDGYLMLSSSCSCFMQTFSVMKSPLKILFKSNSSFTSIFDRTCYRIMKGGYISLIYILSGQSSQVLTNKKMLNQAIIPWKGGAAWGGFVQLWYTFSGRLNVLCRIKMISFECYERPILASQGPFWGIIPISNSDSQGVPRWEGRKTA